MAQKNKPELRVVKLAPVSAASAPSAPRTKAEAGDRRPPSNAIVSNVLTIEDDFARFYGGQPSEGPTLIRPPYNPRQLEIMVQTNNALEPCISAMVQNIDGTGAVIETADETDQEEDKDPARDRLEQFFEEVYPGVSMTTLRRLVRRDLEATGNGYIEALRNVGGELTFLRHMQASTCRIVFLDEPVFVTRKIMRGGSEVEIGMWVRERRFAQVVGSKLVYFKEFGASRRLSKSTGRWLAPDAEVSPSDLATEVIHLTVNRDSGSPYGVPRWEGQIPSVLGSRKAEEHNLEFFDAGGIPPALVIVSGGSMAEGAAQALTDLFSGRAKDRHRAAVLEVFASGGSLDKEGQVKVTVERFGSERQADSMFENYDERCELRIRKAFRLPGIFVGKSQDYSFATAFASYTVAEAQVFLPEREEFDEVVNGLIMPEIDPSRQYVYRSLPLAVQDAAMQLAAVKDVAAAGAIESEELVKAVNEITNLSLTPSETPVDTISIAQKLTGIEQARLAGALSGKDMVDAINEVCGLDLKYTKVSVDEPGVDKPPPPPFGGQPGAKPPGAGQPPASVKATPGDAPTPGQQAKSEEDAVARPIFLAARAARFMEKPTKSEAEAVMAGVGALDPAERPEFEKALAMFTFGDVSHDPAGMARLSGCTLAILAGGFQ